MGEDERQGVARKRPDRATDMLHGVPAEVDLNLEVFVAVRRRQCRASRLVTDVEIHAIAALLHPVGGDARLIAHGWLVIAENT
jgi:hypothetical protein